MSIFVSIASYCDPELLPTILDAYDKAKHPEKLRFGILDQSSNDNYDRLPSWRDQIRYVWMKARDARGVGFARSVIQGMVEDEDYLLQIDSHMRFDSNWDEILIEQMNQLPWKSILTASPMPWEPATGPRRLPEGKTIKLMPHKEYPLRNAANIVSWDPEFGFVNGDRLAAGFLFSRGCLYDHLPYDHSLYFNGEEYTYAQRALAAGWIIYHPKLIPVYHLYKSAEKTSDQVHWGRTVDRYWDPSTLRAKGERRIEAIMKGASGIYSIPIPSPLSKTSCPLIHTPSFPSIDEKAESNSKELSLLFHDLLTIVYGAYSSLPAGRHSAFVQRVNFGQKSYVLKASNFDPSRERSTNPSLLPSSVSWNGSGYACPSVFFDLVAPHGHYILYEYLDILDLTKKSYSDTLEESIILRGIGEFNACNMESSTSLQILHKSFGLSLTHKRLQRRFPKIQSTILAQSLSRAQSINRMLLSRVAAHDSNYYSISHDDLHRGNMSIGQSGRVLNKAVFIDFSCLCWAPIGTDLQFFIYYFLRSSLDRKKLVEVIDQYMAGFAVGNPTSDLNQKLVLEGAMWSYIHKWLNIHRRPLSPRDWTIFNQCLDVAELFFKMETNEFLARLPSVLASGG